MRCPAGRRGAALKIPGPRPENGHMAQPAPARRPFVLLAALLVVLSLAAPARAGASGSSGSAWTDVPKGSWARSAIDLVAWTNAWMRDFGRRTFKPKAHESRQLLAKAVVQAFAPNDQPDPNVTFSDVSPTDPYWAYDSV